MTGSRYEEPFMKVIGEKDFLQPTPSRIGWLVLGLTGALLLGFIIGLTAPRRSSAGLDH